MFCEGSTDLKLKGCTTRQNNVKHLHYLSDLWLICENFLPLAICSPSFVLHPDLREQRDGGGEGKKNAKRGWGLLGKSDPEIEQVIRLDGKQRQ